MLNQIPRPLLVFLVLSIGIALFFVIQKPQSVCTSQLVIFQESQQGQIFPRQGKTSLRPAIYPRLIENCKVGNAPGACYELFNLLRKLVRDLNGSPNECLIPFGEVDEVKRALYQGTRLIVQAAWGERPPDQGISKFGWMETSDLALFCQLKDVMIKIYGEPEWEIFRLATHHELPGEAQIIKDGTCLNCDQIKKAADVLSAEDIWVRSLFSLRCEQFR